MRSDLTKFWMGNLRLLLLSGLMGAWCGAGFGQEKPAGGVVKAQALREEGPNVLLVMVEGWSGSESLVTDKRPNLSRLSGMGVRFESAYPVCNGDNAGRTAVLTGTCPWESGVVADDQDWRKALLLVDRPSLPELFRAGGFVTGGGGKIFYRPQVVKGSKEVPLGFDLTGAWDERFDVGPDDRKTVDWAAKFIRTHHGAPFFCAVGLENAASLESGLGKWLTALEKGGRVKDTVVVLMGIPSPDMEAAKPNVPLLIYAAGAGSAGKSVSALVSLVDVYPTLVELVGGLNSPEGLPGRSLVPLLEDPEPAWDRPLVQSLGLPDNQAVRVLDQNWSYERNESGMEKLESRAVDENLVNGEPMVAEQESVKSRLAGLVPTKWARYSRAVEKIDYDASADGVVTYWLEGGDDFAADTLPDLTGRGLDIELVFEYRAEEDANGALISAGDERLGFAVHLQDGKPSFTINYDGLRTTLAAEKTIEDGWVKLRALMGVDGSLDVGVMGKDGHGYAPMEGGFPRRLPGRLTVGEAAGVLPAKEFPRSTSFKGKIGRVAFGLLPGVTEELRAVKAIPVE